MHICRRDKNKYITRKKPGSSQRNWLLLPILCTSSKEPVKKLKLIILSKNHADHAPCLEWKEAQYMPWRDVPEPSDDFSSYIFCPLQSNIAPISWTREGRKEDSGQNQTEGLSKYGSQIGFYSIALIRLSPHMTPFYIHSESSDVSCSRSLQGSKRFYEECNYVSIQGVAHLKLIDNCAFLGIHTSSLWESRRHLFLTLRRNIKIISHWTSDMYYCTFHVNWTLFKIKLDTTLS